MATVVTGDLYESITGQLFELGRQLRQQSGYPFSPVELQRHLQAAIEGRFDGQAAIFSLAVNYGRSVEEGVRAGYYDWVNPDITSEHFPTERQESTHIMVELIHLNRVVSTDEAIRKLDQMGYRPIELRELQALGEQYPDLQRKFPIVELGSVWRDSDGNRYVASLDGSVSGRRLTLNWVEVDWDEDFRFGSVRK